MKTIILVLAFFWTYSDLSAQATNEMAGAWKSDAGVLVFSDQYFSYTEFSPTEFKFTYGGSWKASDNQVGFAYEYHTKTPAKVGTEENHQVEINGNNMTFEGNAFIRLDDGTPGNLSGTWLFNNRIRDGQLGTPREADNPRKTMKILSGTRFQWIAYNTETKEFSGTGGGTYTTVDGKYTENIDFFSRDIERVGASLQFDFELKADEWHHQGLSSRGDPIYEIWKLRKID